jgi:hypothetical protein
LLLAMSLGTGGCDPEESDCGPTPCPGCRDCDVDSGPGDGNSGPMPCEQILRPAWECVALLDCDSPRDLNLFANAWFECPQSLPVCCVRDFFPPQPSIDAGLADGGE